VNLSSRGVQIATSQFPMCNMHDESTQHLFLNCPVGTKVWASCDRWIVIHQLTITLLVIISSISLL